MVLRVRNLRKVGGRGIPLGAEMGGGKRDEPDRTFPHSLVFFSPPWTWPLFRSSGDTHGALRLDQCFSELSLCRKPHNPSVSTPVGLYSPIKG